MELNLVKGEFGVTRLGDLLDFGQLFMPLAAINLPKSPKFLGNFCKGVKIYHFSSEIIFGQLYRHLAIFSGHTEKDEQMDKPIDQTSMECRPSCMT